MGDKPIGTIRRGDLQAWTKQVSSRRSPALVRQVFYLVATVFKSAVADRIVAQTPCGAVVLPDIVAEQIVPLTVAEVRKIVDAASPPQVALIVLAATTGLRSGELLGLTQDNVLWLQRRVRVRQQLIYIPGQEPFLDEPKTPSSYREVPVPPFALDLLARHVKEWPPGTDGLIFQADRGGPIKRSNQWARWQRNLRHAGLSKEIHFHHLRHHYASLLIFGGESVVTVSRRLGHASVAETLKTYAHLWPDSEVKTRNVLEAAWSEEDEDSVRTEDLPHAPDLGG